MKGRFQINYGIYLGYCIRQHNTYYFIIAFVMPKDFDSSRALHLCHNSLQLHVSKAIKMEINFT